MARWGVDAIRFRLRGSTDEATEKLLGEIKQVLQRGPGARDRAAWRPRCWSGCCRGSTRRCSTEVYAHQDAGRADLHRQRGRRRARPAARPDPLHGRRDRDQLRGRRGRAASPASSAARSCTARARSRRCGEFAAEHEIDLDELLRVLGLGLGPADAARGRQPGRRQPRRGAGRGSPASEGWRVMRFEKLGRRLAIAGARPRAARRAPALPRDAHRIAPWTPTSSRSPASRARRS